MKGHRLGLIDRLWDHAPALLLLFSLLQVGVIIALLALGALAFFPSSSVARALRSVSPMSVTTLIDAVPPIAPPLPTVNSSAPCVVGDHARFAGRPVLLSETLKKNPGVDFGIDVSEDQGQIDWLRARAAGVRFAFIKATDGSSRIDRCFRSNWNGARNAGILRGAYHVFRAQEPEQALHFLSVVESEQDPGELPAGLDLESSALNGEDLSIAKLEIGAWLQAVLKQTQTAPLVYGSLSVFSGYFSNTPPRGFALWIAEYTNGPLHVASSWPQWRFWQFSQSGTVDGILGAVDLNRHNSQAAPLSSSFP